ncbi:carbohydrate ABC transporter permease [Streptomyces sp. B6B3]|uniref:carbohydrate ABC transporter permease n=1 Tax=Streptomyces sp. B6B3 TaxID=3153570 RepID=UPI00325E11FB
MTKQVTTSVTTPVTTSVHAAGRGRAAPGARLSTVRAERAQRVVSYLLLVVGAAVFILPFLWMLSTALKGDDEISQYPPDFLPTSFHWDNFVKGWQALPFGTFLLNTVLITTAAVVGTVLSCLLTAYAFARVRARGRGVLFGLMLATMMVPAEITIVPVFAMFAKLQLVNTFWPLILPAWFGSAYFTFLIRQFMMTVPQELDEAARIDGASHMRILFQIIVPQIKPAIATVTAFSFISNWNNLLGPLIYLRDQDQYTLALGLSLFQGQYSTQYNQMMAVALLTLIPVIVVFLIAQRMFIRGVALSGFGGR